MKMIAIPRAFSNLVLFLVSNILHDHVPLAAVITMWKERHIVEQQIPWMQLANQLQASGVTFTISRCSTTKNNILNFRCVGRIHYHTAYLCCCRNIFCTGIATRY